MRLRPSSRCFLQTKSWEQPDFVSDAMVWMRPAVILRRCKPTSSLGCYIIGTAYAFMAMLHASSFMCSYLRIGRGINERQKVQCMLADLLACVGPLEFTSHPSPGQQKTVNIHSLLLNRAGVDGELKVVNLTRGLSMISAQVIDVALRGRTISPVDRVLLVSWWLQDLTCSLSGDITRRQAALLQALTELQLPGHILSWLGTGMVVLAPLASQLAQANSFDRQQQAPLGYGRLVLPH